MNLEQVIENQREFFKSGSTKEIHFRKQMLKKLKISLTEYESRIYDALKKDLNKCEYESFFTEICVVHLEIDNAIKHIDKWTKKNKKKKTFSTVLHDAYTIYEPYGVALILAPWNYPIQLILSPVIGAITAGNCAIVGASKTSVETSEVMTQLINETFDQNYIYAMDNHVNYNTVLNQRYDYIFYTGGERVGRIVMRAASEHLTPITLELGGKSPCIIEHSADIKDAAKKIVWTKCLNAGQTCIAPDYVLIDNARKDEFIEALKREYKEGYGDGCNNEQFPKIINLHHYMRLMRFIEKEQEVIGGSFAEEKLKIGFTIFPNASFSSEIMKEEIFGPILPIIGYDSLDYVIDILKEREKPLACYVFAKDKKIGRYIIHNISFGGGCLNDCIMHIANDNLPFGGVGNSGMGKYHGKYSFQTFSNEKSILEHNFFWNIPFVYAPFKEKNKKILKMFLK